MKIVLNHEMRSLDDSAIKDFKIPSLVLMENAGREAANVVSNWANRMDCKNEILIICGKGKNGGDGFVTARHLITMGYKVRVFLCNERNAYTGEPAINLEILEKLRAKITIIESINTLAQYFETTAGPYLVVDALLGTGLDRDIDGLYYEIIQCLNEKATEIISLDIPSGVMGDCGKICGISIEASATVSFGYPKIGHFLPPGAAKRGHFYNVDLGFPRKWNQKSDHFLLTHANTAPLLTGRDRFGHKNTFGHCLAIGGSPGRLGAIVMSALSCLKMGAGLVTVASWDDSFPTLDSKLPMEFMSYKIRREGGSFVEPDGNFLEAFNTVVVGPGFGLRPEGAPLLRYLINNFQGALIIDADGLNLAAEYKMHDLLLRRMYPTILTPHVGEMARFLNCTREEIKADPLASLKRCVEVTGSIVVLKGATTLIQGADGTTWFNHQPNDGMAKAGSGDVLAGMIAGLLAQKVEALQATKLGVYTHSLAGRLCAKDLGVRSMIAGNVIDHITHAIKDLSEYVPPQYSSHCIQLL